MGARRTIRCWRCGDNIPAERTGVTCPTCGAALAPEAYHVLAPLVREEASLAVEGIRTMTARIRAEQQWGRAQAGPLRLLRHIPVIGPRILQTHDARMRELERTRAEFQDIQTHALETLRAYAEASYYCGPWFQETGTPLPHGGKPGQCPLLSVRYNEVGRLVEKPNLTSNAGRGAYGEYLAFGLLAQAMREGRLGHARLLARLYVPEARGHAQKYGPSQRSSEIDLLLVTEAATFVVEAKHRHRDVLAKVDSRSGKTTVKMWEVGPDGSPFGTAEDDGGPRQAWGHRAALAQQGVYGVDLDSVVPVVTYVGCERFRVQGERDQAEVLPTCAGPGPDGLVEAIERELARRGSARGAAEVDAIADELRARFSDPRGEKRKRHLRYIEEQRSMTLRARSKAPSNTRWTRACDSDLTRMIDRSGMREARPPRRHA